MLFTAIFSTISVIEDRQEGFLQGVLVAPVPRLAIVAGKVLGGTTLALLQAGAVPAARPADLRRADRRRRRRAARRSWRCSPSASPALGFLIAWRLDSTQGFHAIMNLFLVPMWMLSGALFPAGGAAGWIRARHAGSTR